MKNLSAQFTCEGSTQEVFGVSACRANQGSHQVINFENPVSWVFSEGCPDPITEDSKKFTLTADSRKCFYLFENDDGFHRTTVIGFKKRNQS